MQLGSMTSPRSFVALRMTNNLIGQAGPKLQISNHKFNCNYFSSRAKKSSVAPYALIQLFHIKNP
jgi:hypothetical protein